MTKQKTAIQIISGTSDQTSLVFLHGYLLSSSQWINLALKRAPWRSVLLDLPYHGENKSALLSQKSMKAYADFVQAELQKIGVERYHLVGHSMGGYIGLELLKQDKNLDKLILLHSNIWADSEERKRNRERVAVVVKRNKTLFLRESLPLLFKDKHKHQTVILELIREASAMSAEGIAHGALSMRDRLDKVELVRKNAQRIFFIQGSNDALIPLKEAEEVWKKYAREDHFFVIPDSGHMSHLERPRTLRRLLEDVVL
jgi:pimeloyl-ACP methyl ester carboxylesterase